MRCLHQSVAENEKYETAIATNMTIVSKKTHTLKGGHQTQPDLLAAPAGTRPVAGQFATAIQLKPITGLDYDALMRLANVNNPNPARSEEQRLNSSHCTLSRMPSSA